MNEIDILGFVIEWWWLLLFAMRPGLVNLVGGYFAGVYLAHTKPDVAKKIITTVTDFIGALSNG